MLYSHFQGHEKCICTCIPLHFPTMPTGYIHYYCLPSQFLAEREMEYQRSRYDAPFIRTAGGGAFRAHDPQRAVAKGGALPVSGQQRLNCVSIRYTYL